MADVKAHENENFESLLKRFNKKVQQEAILREMCRREYYEKPSEIKRRARLRAERRARRMRLLSR